MKKTIAICLLFALILGAFACARPTTAYRVVQTGSGDDGTSGGYVIVFYRESDGAVTGINIEARFDRNSFVKAQIEALKQMDYFSKAIPGFKEMPFAEEEQLDESDFFTLIARIRELDNDDNMAQLLNATFINAESAAELRTADGFIAAMSAKILREILAEEIPNLGLHIG